MDRVAGVLTRQERDITDVVNGSSRPLSLLGCWFGENSSLDEDSWRDRGACDISGNLPHVSICRAVDAHLVPPNDKEAFRRWTADTPVVLDTARAWYETNITWAEETLGADHPDVDLLCCLWWNAPAAGAVEEARTYGMADPRTRAASAEYWLADDLVTRPGGTKYAANRKNYERGLKQAEKYRVEVPPMADITLPTKGPDPVFASLEDAAAFAGSEAYRKQLIETACWAIGVRDEALYKQCYETLNPSLYVPLFDQVDLPGK